MEGGRGGGCPGTPRGGPTHTRGSEPERDERDGARRGGRGGGGDLKVKGERLKSSNVNEKGQSK